MNSAGRMVEISVPKNGTMATSPVKIPNASQYGTPRIQRPIAVRAANTAIAISWPTTQARSVADVSSNTATAMGRCGGANKEIRPSRYIAGCLAR